MGARFPAVGEEIYQNGKGEGRNNSDVLYWNRRHWCECQGGEGCSSIAHVYDQIHVSSHLCGTAVDWHFGNPVYKSHGSSTCHIIASK